MCYIRVGKASSFRHRTVWLACGKLLNMSAFCLKWGYWCREDISNWSLQSNAWAKKRIDVVRKRMNEKCIGSMTVFIRIHWKKIEFCRCQYWKCALSSFNCANYNSFDMIQMKRRLKFLGQKWSENVTHWSKQFIIRGPRNKAWWCSELMLSLSAYTCKYIALFKPCTKSAFNQRFEICFLCLFRGWGTLQIGEYEEGTNWGIQLVLSSFKLYSIFKESGSWAKTS